MVTKKQIKINIQTKESIRSEIVNQQKKAYYLTKYLRSKTNRDMSYIISTELKYKNGFWFPVTTIKELPEIRIHHGAVDSEEEFMKLIDIENMDG